MPQRAMRTAEIVVREVKDHMSIQAILALGESQRFSGQPLVLLADGEVAPLDERRGDAGPASILTEDLLLLHFDQMAVAMMLDDLSVSQFLIRNVCWQPRPSSQASSGERDDAAVKLQ